MQGKELEEKHIIPERWSTDFTVQTILETKTLTQDQKKHFSEKCLAGTSKKVKYTDGKCAVPSHRIYHSDFLCSFFNTMPF